MKEAMLLCALGYAYAGVQSVTKCYCVSHYEMYIPLRDSSCGMSCSGGLNQICGGELARSLYSTSPLGEQLTICLLLQICLKKYNKVFFITTDNHVVLFTYKLKNDR